jgi:hypothetical protein
MAKGSTGWGRVFDEPITLPGGNLVTLRDAASYITALPTKEADAPEWQAAIEALMLVVEFGGPTMFARIGVMRALNRGRREFNPSQKMGAEKAKEGPMKPYLLIAISGLILCATAGVILLETALLVSPD